jgi:diaminopimelate epimerase
MKFTKMQGVGNDFVVVDLLDVGTHGLPSLARHVCKRKFSIGADGLLVIGRGTADSAFSFRMFNPDGSEDMCGNGIRCACLWAYRRSIVSAGKIPVATKDGLHECHLISADETTAMVQVNMGAANLTASKLPMIGPADETYIRRPIAVMGKEYLTTVVNTGSTHSVIFLGQAVDDQTFFTVSPEFENLPQFPERTSVLWAWKTGPNHFFVRIWERGAGETLGCGTGACAVGVAAILNELSDREDAVTVESKGGSLHIRWNDVIWMTGPAVFVYEGNVEM